MAASWERKLARAEHHLRDFNDLVAPYQGRRAYPVSEGFEPDDDQWPYVYRLDIPEPENPLLPIIVGDLMFNLRSALDHLATAMVPEPLRSLKTAFPIFATDIDELDPTTGHYLHRKARKRWKAIIKGFPEGAMTAVEEAQPYIHRREGRNPQYAAIELLRAFQNADKHSRLVFVVSGFKDPTIWINVSETRKIRARLPGIPSDRMLAPRTIVRRERDPLTSHVNVEAEGTLEIAIGDGADGAYYGCPNVFEAMLRDVRGLIERLARYAIHAPPPARRAVA